MAQLSRPFQIALAAVLLFAVVWFVALGGGHGSSSNSTPSTSTPTASSTPSAHPVAGSTHIEGMTRAVAHAHEAVAASQRASEKSAASSAETPSQGAGVTSSSTTVTTKHGATHTSTTVATTHVAKHGATHTSTTVATTHGASHTSTTVATLHGAAGASATVTTKHVVVPAPHKVASGGIPPRQAAIESELKRGEVAVVLFWNPKGADDDVVHDELQVLLAAHHEVAVHPNKAQVAKLRLLTGLELEKKIAVHYASAKQVASFGTFTKTVQVYGTPTILIINKSGQTTTLTGLQDYYSIEQTIDEARQAQS